MNATNLTADELQRDYPATDSQGRPVLGYDNGTGRPGTAPIDRDGGTAGDQLPSDSEQPGVPTRGDGDSGNVTANPIDPSMLYLGLPRTTRYTTAIVLDAIAIRRAEQDAKWGGPIHDDEHDELGWLNLIDVYVEKAGLGTDNAITLDRMLDLAAVAAAAIESLTRQQEARDAQQKEDAAGNGGDSTGLADADTNLADGADEGLAHLEGATVETAAGGADETANSIDAPAAVAEGTTFYGEAGGQGI